MIRALRTVAGVVFATLVFLGGMLGLMGGVAVLGLAMGAP